MNAGELEFVQWLMRQQRRHPSMPVGIGDDMAVLDSPAGRILFASDMLIDGVHFDTLRHDLAQIGRKAVACNLSDCAAMAARPTAVTVSVALPDGFALAEAQKLFQGMRTVAEEFDVAIAGGDTTRWSHPLAIDVAVIAHCHEGIEPVLRSGAKPGDRIYVTGRLGGSLRGRHLTFRPRVEEAGVLACAMGNGLHAMIDVSDGLSLDLWRVCSASGVEAVLDERELAAVISDDAKAAAAEDGRSPLDHALSDGEDYELLIAASREPDNLQFPLHAIGSIVEKGAGFGLRRSDGRIEPLEPKGWVH
jgi:thiamine-monophosphate kinase